jgi:phasin family protein
MIYKLLTAYALYLDVDLFGVFMAISHDIFAVSNKALVDTLVNVANTALAAAERIVALNSETARTLVSDSASNTKALLEAKTPQEIFDIQANVTQPNISKAAAYSRGLYEIAKLAQESLLKQVQNQ